MPSNVPSFILHAHWLKMKLFILFCLGVVTVMGNDSQDLQKYHESNVQFTSDTYKGLKKSVAGNFVMSPVSVELALALAQIGARGETAKQLSLATHLPTNPDEIFKMFAAVTPSLKGTDQYTFDSANKIYVKHNYKLSEDYKTKVTDVFGAAIQSIDFEKKEAAANEMNKWVEEKTHNKITNLINSEWLNEDTRAVLMNALYFKGKWETQFKTSTTKKEHFYIDGEHFIDTHMMHIESRFNYYENKNLNTKFLEMPYVGKDVTMTIVLPNDPEGLPIIEDDIANVLVTPHYTRSKVNVRIPKFEVKTTIQFKEIFNQLGVVLPFEDGADFGEMIAVDEIEPLKITKIVQKACIEVDEQGTVAAAASGVVMDTWRSARVIEPEIFHADHPFVFYLKHKVAGIIFVGRYSAPEGTVNEGTYVPPPKPNFPRFVLP